MGMWKLNKFQIYSCLWITCVLLYPQRQRNMKTPSDGNPRAFINSFIRKGAGNSTSRNLGSLLRSGSAFAHIAICHYYTECNGESQVCSKEIKPVRVVILIGFLFVVSVVGATLKFMGCKTLAESLGLVNQESRKNRPGSGRDWYALSNVRSLLKNHTQQSLFKKRSVLGAAKPCLFSQLL